MDNSFDKLINRILDGRYKIENVVGIGGMAYVLKASDLQKDGRPVAIKVLNEEFNSDENAVKRFVNESEAVAMVDSPNIVKIYDVAISDSLKYIVMEFIDGITVAEVLEQGKYTYHGAKKIILAVCDALLVLRDMDIVHRDIKPENIMVTRSGDVKLIDFNAARIHKNEKQKDTVILGTIGYAPPEQYGISQSDEKSDIYSLGVLLNVMLTGTHPSRQLARGKAGKIVLKCTQIDPNHRFDNIESLIVKL